VSKKLGSQESKNRIVNLEEAAKRYSNKGWRKCGGSYVLLDVSKAAIVKKKSSQQGIMLPA
jgi:hypothetical protein